MVAVPGDSGTMRLNYVEHAVWGTSIFG